MALPLSERFYGARGEALRGRALRGRVASEVRFARAQGHWPPDANERGTLVSSPLRSFAIFGTNRALHVLQRVLGEELSGIWHDGSALPANEAGTLGLIMGGSFAATTPRIGHRSALGAELPSPPDWQRVYDLFAELVGHVPDRTLAAERYDELAEAAGNGAGLFPSFSGRADPVALTRA